MFSENNNKYFLSKFKGQYCKDYTKTSNPIENRKFPVKLLTNERIGIITENRHTAGIGTFFNLPSLYSILTVKKPRVMLMTNNINPIWNIKA